MLYDKKYLYKMLAIYGFSVVAMYVSRGNAFLLMVPFFLTYLFKNKTDQLFACAVISTVLLQTNSFLVPKPMTFAVAQRALFMLLGLYAGLQLLGQKKDKIIGSMMLILLYLVYMIIPSSIGWYPLISYLKLILFITVFMGYMAIANRCTQNRKSSEGKLRSLFLATAMYYIVGSVLLIPFPGISQLNAMELLDNPNLTSLYKGMTLHSQALGPITCALGLFLVGDLFFNIQKFDKFYGFTLFLVPILIYKTSSRTAMGTLLVGLCFAIYQLSKSRGIKSSWRTKVMSTSMAIISLMSVLVLVIPQTRDGIAKFILKYNSDAKMSDVTLEETMSTRQGKIDQQMYNFKKRPAIGWGFQVSEELAISAKYGGTNSLLSAPVEKGVWIPAILEEGGVFGLGLYLIFCVTVFIALLKAKYYLASLMFVNIHVSNLGEMTMFSLTATGGLIWLLFFFALVLDAERVKRIKRGNMRMYGFVPVRAPINYNPAWR